MEENENGDKPLWCLHNQPCIESGTYCLHETTFSFLLVPGGIIKRDKYPIIVLLMIMMR